jgi:hypothetical protein
MKTNTKTKTTTSVKPATNPAVITVDTSKARVEGVNLNQTRLAKSVKAKTLNDLVEIYSGLFGSNNYRSHLNYDIKKGAIVLES